MSQAQKSSGIEALDALYVPLWTISPREANLSEMQEFARKSNLPVKRTRFLQAEVFVNNHFVPEGGLDMRTNEQVAQEHTDAEDAPKVQDVSPTSEPKEDVVSEPTPEVSSPTSDSTSQVAEAVDTAVAEERAPAQEPEAPADTTVSTPLSEPNGSAEPEGANAEVEAEADSSEQASVSDSAKSVESGSGDVVKTNKTSGGKRSKKPWTKPKLPGCFYHEVREADNNGPLAEGISENISIFFDALPVDAVTKAALKSVIRAHRGTPAEVEDIFKFSLNELVAVNTEGDLDSLIEDVVRSDLAYVRYDDLNPLVKRVVKDLVNGRRQVIREQKAHGAQSSEDQAQAEAS